MGIYDERSTEERQNLRKEGARKDVLRDFKGIHHRSMINCLPSIRWRY